MSGQPGSTVAFKKFLAIMKVLLVMPALVVKLADNNDNVWVRRPEVNVCPENQNLSSMHSGVLWHAQPENLKTVCWNFLNVL